MGRPSYLGLQTSFLKSFEIIKNASVLNSAFLNKLSLTGSRVMLQSTDVCRGLAGTTERCKPLLNDSTNQPGR